MPRASSVLCLAVVLALAGQAAAIELPVITNGTQVAQAPPAPAEKPASNVQPPVIHNYPSAATQPAEGAKSDIKLPMIVNQPAVKVEPAKAPAARVAVAYLASENLYMSPVGYNAYGGGGSILGAYGYGGYGYGGYGYMAPSMGGYFGGYAYDAYTGYAPAMALTPSILDLRPPRVEVLDTGVRPNVGRLASMPAVSNPVFNQVIAVYYR